MKPTIASAAQHYAVLARLNEMSDGALLSSLFALASLQAATCCPQCGLGAFAHARNCSLFKRMHREFRKLDDDALILPRPKSARRGGRR